MFGRRWATTRRMRSAGDEEEESSGGLGGSGMDGGGGGGGGSDVSDDVAVAVPVPVEEEHESDERDAAGGLEVDFDDDDEGGVVVDDVGQNDTKGGALPDVDPLPEPLPDDEAVVGGDGTGGAAGGGGGDGLSSLLTLARVSERSSSAPPPSLPAWVGDGSGQPPPQLDVDVPVQVQDKAGEEEEEEEEVQPIQVQAQAAPPPKPQQQPPPPTQGDEPRPEATDEDKGGGDEKQKQIQKRPSEAVLLTPWGSCRRCELDRSFKKGHADTCPRSRRYKGGPPCAPPRPRPQGGITVVDVDVHAGKVDIGGGGGGGSGGSEDDFSGEDSVDEEDVSIDGDVTTDAKGVNDEDGTLDAKPSKKEDKDDDRRDGRGGSSSTKNTRKVYIYRPPTPLSTATPPPPFGLHLEDASLPFGPRSVSVKSLSSVSFPSPAHPLRRLIPSGSVILGVNGEDVWGMDCGEVSELIREEETRGGQVLVLALRVPRQRPPPRATALEDDDGVGDGETAMTTAVHGNIRGLGGEIPVEDDVDAEAQLALALASFRRSPADAEHDQIAHQFVVTCKDDGDTVILDQYDCTEVEWNTYDPARCDPPWYRRYRELLALRNGEARRITTLLNGGGGGGGEAKKGANVKKEELDDEKKTKSSAKGKKGQAKKDDDETTKTPKGRGRKKKKDSDSKTNPYSIQAKAQAIQAAIDDNYTLPSTGYPAWLDPSPSTHPELHKWVLEQRSFHAKRRPFLSNRSSDSEIVKSALGKMALLSRVGFVWTTEGELEESLEPLRGGEDDDGDSDEGEKSHKHKHGHKSKDDDEDDDESKPSSKGKKGPDAESDEDDETDDEDTDDEENQGRSDDREWRRRCLEYARHTFTRGHGNVPSNTPLGQWCREQRARRRMEGRLTEESEAPSSLLCWCRVLTLSSAGFDWSNDADELGDWDAMRMRFADYVRRNGGDGLIPTPGEVREVLLENPTEKRGRKNKGKKRGRPRKVRDEDEEKKDAEESDGAVEDEDEDKPTPVYSDGASAKKRPKKKTPAKKPEDAKSAAVLNAPHPGDNLSECDVTLWWWTQHQRIERNRLLSGLDSHLTPRRIEQLDEAGFVWDAADHIVSKRKAAVAKAEAAEWKEKEKKRKAMMLDVGAGEERRKKLKAMKEKIHRCSNAMNGRSQKERDRLKRELFMEYIGRF